MSTIGKALSLLDLISQLDKDIGLSDLARLAALDKATARRFLVELEKQGFVEQDGETRKYRLGAAPVRLARPPGSTKAAERMTRQHSFERWRSACWPSATARI